MAVMEAHGVRTMAVAGLSYGGFVAYAMAAQFKERVERVVLIGSGVSLEEKDMEVEGFLKVKSIEEAAAILFPQSPAMFRQLLRLSFYKPPSRIPSWFARDFIHVRFTGLLKLHYIRLVVRNI